MSFGGFTFCDLVFTGGFGGGLRFWVVCLLELVTILRFGFV